MGRVESNENIFTCQNVLGIWYLMVRFSPGDCLRGAGRQSPPARGVLAVRGRPWDGEASPGLSTLEEKKKNVGM